MRSIFLLALLFLGVPAVTHSQVTKDEAKNMAPRQEDVEKSWVKLDLSPRT